MADSERPGPFSPVFLEPRDDWWEIHRPKRVSMDDQRAFELVAHETAAQLENAVYCEDCFPEKG